MSHSKFILVLLAVLLPAAAAAQDARRVVSAMPLGPEQVIRLDGIPDEDVWERVEPATNFLQREPDNGAPATEQTEVRIVYDANRIILGVTLHDSEPDRLLGNQMQRDQAFSADDRFMWAIDTFRDGRNGYFFEINPSGAMGDGLIDPSEDGQGLGAGANKSWDGIWTARVRRGPGGWTAEIEIPFKTLNFEPGAPAWGINFQRTVRRKNEESLWTGYARNQGLRRMSNAGLVQGFSGLTQGIGLDVKPYAVGSVLAAPGRGQAGSVATGDVGLDAFYNVTPALRANVSVNTDFAQTEVDQRQVNLTRFPLFFEEKRDFFLEGSSYFDFAREQGNHITPFFSRTIGLNQGLPQRIDIGGKLTGQVGAFDVGFLQVRTGEDTRQGEDFSVLRLRRRMFQQSYVGVLYTLRSTRGATIEDRHTTGLDFLLQTSTFRGDQNVALSGYYIGTSNLLDTGDSGAYGFRLEYPNDPFGFDLAVREIERNYSPAVGFLQRRGYKRANPSAEYTWRISGHPLVRNVSFEADAEFINDPENRPLTRELSLTPFDLNFHSGASVSMGVSRFYERLDEDFEISDGVVLPVDGRYRYTRYSFSGETPDRWLISVAPSVEFGDFYSGDRKEYTLEVGIRPRRGVLVGVELEHNVLDLAEGSFSTDVYRLTANTQFSPWMSVANNLQFDSVSRGLGWQMRFRWIQRPGNDVYFVYNHNWQEITLDGLRRFETIDNRATSKLIYTLRF